MSTPLWQPRHDATARLLGLGFALVGAAILHWQIVVPLRQAAAGAADIAYSFKLLALGEMFLVLGSYWLATGLAGYQRVLRLQKDRRFLALVGAASLAGIGLTHYFMLQQLATHGYSP